MRYSVPRWQCRKKDLAAVSWDEYWEVERQLKATQREVFARFCHDWLAGTALLWHDTDQH
jgi:hypothetical protein